MIGLLLALGMVRAEVPIGGYRHLSLPSTAGQVALNTEALTDFDTTVIAQTRLAGQIGELVVLGFEVPYLIQTGIYTSTDPSSPWGGQHVELRMNPVRIYDRIRAHTQPRSGTWDLGLEVSHPWGSENQAGFWAVTPLEAINWRRTMVALRTASPVGEHGYWMMVVAAGTLHTDVRLLAGQVTLTASTITRNGAVVGEVDFTNTPLANAISVTGMLRRTLHPRFDAGIGLNLPVSEGIFSSLQVVSQLRMTGQP